MIKDIIECVKQTTLEASKIYGRNFDIIPSKFDLRGRVAGQFVYRGITGKPENPCIDSVYYRFNLYIAEANKDRYMSTVKHEVAHYIARILNYGKKIMPHGKEWKSVMRNFGLEPKVTHSYTVPSTSRKLKTFTYECSCMKHEITSIIHNKIIRGGTKPYKRVCKKCKGVLRFVKAN